MNFKMVRIVLATVLLVFIIAGCDSKPTSDSKQQTQQEQMLIDATNSVGMPAVKNWQEKRNLKDILELRDKANLLTYTYVENLAPNIIRGKTVMGGKFTFMGESIGYGIPYATQYTNPQKVEYHTSSGYVSLPQADPNGLFSPPAADGTWVLMKDPHGKDVKPVYIEPKIMVSQFKYDFD